MKKIFFAVAAAFALVSCVKDELDPGALIPPPEPEVVYDYSKLVLNELCGDGEDNEKYIELYNNGSTPIDLKDVTINKDEELTWTGVKGQVIPAKGVFAIVGAKGTTADGFSSGFSAKKSVLVELFAPDGTKLDTFQRGEKGSEWGAQGLTAVKASWSRVPDGTGKFLITDKTPGAVNAKSGEEDPTLVGNGEISVTPVVLNELYGAGEDNEKFFELYNNLGVTVNIEGYTIKKDEELCWTAPKGATIPGNGFFQIVGAKGTTETGFSSGFSSKKSVIIELFDAEGKKLDTFQRGEKGSEWGGESLDNNKGSWSRIPDGTGKFMMTETITLGKANAKEGKEDPKVVQ